jgi:predicted O-methyltransferase YrrM
VDGQVRADSINNPIKLGQKVLQRVVHLREQVAFAYAYRKIRTIEGFLSTGQEKWLFSAVRSLPNSATVVEIGAYLGRSTASLALACRGTNRHIFSIDIFEGVYDDVRNTVWQKSFERNFLAEWCENMKRAHVTDHVTPLMGQSADIGRDWSKPINLLFIDGSHQYTDVVTDFETFFPHVVEGGIVALHDVTPSWPGPQKAWHGLIVHRLEATGFCGSLAYGRKPRGGQTE